MNAPIKKENVTQRFVSSQGDIWRRRGGNEFLRVPAASFEQ